MISILTSFSYNTFASQSPSYIQVANAIKHITSNHTTPSLILQGGDNKDPPSTTSNTSNTSVSNSHCISFDPSNRTITVSCSSGRLSDVNNQLHDNSILTKQSPLGTWSLSANLVIAKRPHACALGYLFIQSKRCTYLIHLLFQSLQFT